MPRSDSNRVRTLATLGVSLLAATSASAQLDYALGPPNAIGGVTLDGATPTSISESVEDFNVLFVTMTHGFPADTPYVRTSVDADIELLPLRYTASGTVSAVWVEPIPTLPERQGGRGGTAYASIRAQFFVTEPIPYRMSLTSTETGVQDNGDDLSAWVRLINGTNSTLPISAGLEPISTVQTGTLTPGFYILQFGATAKAAETGAVFGTVTFDFDLAMGEAVPPPPTCAADFDASGAVNVSDIFAFLAAWFAQSTGSDFDNSGATNVADIFAFLTAWFAGCP